MKFYPYGKGEGGGCKNVQPCSGGGGETKYLGTFYVVPYSFTHIEGGGALTLHSLKWKIVILYLRGGGGEVYDPPIFTFL